MNPISSLRKLGIKLVGDNGLLSAAAMKSVGLGPLRQMDIINQAKQRGIKEATDIQGIDKTSLDMAGEEQRQDQSAELQPGKVLDQDITNKTGQVDLDKKVQDEADRKTTAIQLAKILKENGMDVTPEEADGYISALSGINRSGNMIISPDMHKQHPGIPQGLVPDETVRINAEDERTKRAEAVQRRLIEQYQSNQNRRSYKEDFQIHDRVKKEIADVTKNAGYTSDTAALTKFGDIQSAYDNAVKAASVGGTLNPDTQIIINDFNKILDPASVVRESEFARSQLGESWYNNMIGLAQRVAQGGSLPLSVLKSYVDSVRVLSNNAKHRQEIAKQKVRAKIATVPGIANNPDKIEAYMEANFGDYGSGDGNSSIIGDPKVQMLLDNALEAAKAGKGGR